MNRACLLSTSRPGSDPERRPCALVGERQRIIRDIHDGLGASLIGLLRYVQRGDIDRRTLEQQVRSALLELQVAVDALAPADGDLGAVLGNLRYRLEPLLAASAVDFRWEATELPRIGSLHPAESFSIQRIVLEAIANALKHSGASHIAMSIRRRRGGVEILICDNGRGFDAVSASPGLGLVSMRARAKHLGGRLEIGAAGSGTMVKLVIPRRLGAGRSGTRPRATSSGKSAPAQRASPNSG